jgi:hypothetical protein
MTMTDIIKALTERDLLNRGIEPSIGLFPTLSLDAVKIICSYIKKLDLSTRVTLLCVNKSIFWDKNFMKIDDELHELLYTNLACCQSTSDDRHLRYGSLIINTHSHNLSKSCSHPVFVLPSIFYVLRCVEDVKQQFSLESKQFPCFPDVEYVEHTYFDGHDAHEVRKKCGHNVSSPIRRNIMSYNPYYIYYNEDDPVSKLCQDIITLLTCHKSFGSLIVDKEKCKHVVDDFATKHHLKDIYILAQIYDLSDLPKSLIFFENRVAVSTLARLYHSPG